MIHIKKIVLATHGMLADGYRNTLQILGAETEHLTMMCFYNGKNNYDTEIAELFSNLKEEDQLIICTDIKFGSINQLFMKESMKYGKDNVFLVSGINLPLLLELSTSQLSSQEPISIALLNDLVNKARQEVVVMDTTKSLIHDSNNEMF